MDPSTPAARAGTALVELNAGSEAAAQAALLPCCASPVWARAVAAARPFGDVEHVYAAADAAIAAMGEADIDQALAGHPRIGERSSGPEPGWSREEQSGVDGAGEATRRRIAAGNLAYEERFRRIYLVCATGRSADELLAMLEQRLTNSPEAERAVVREELRRITRLRLGKLLT